MPHEEVILPFPAPRAAIEPAQRYRSTWIVSSLQALRAHGHFDRYVELLPAASRDELLNMVAGVWIPMPLARDHYLACEALDLDDEEELRMGGSVGARAQGSVLSTVVRAARGAGVTPWTILPQFQRLWNRGADGGGVCVTKLGPKDARVEIVGCGLFDIDYFRHAFRGVQLGVIALFCQKAYVREEPRRSRGDAFYHLQWA